MGRFILVAIALLIVTVGVLATESRFPQAGQRDSACWHSSKASRMTECGGKDLAPPLSEESRSASRIVKPVVLHFLPFRTLTLPELAGAPQAHGLRAPPLV
jgi:hypothetical protein